MSNTDLSRLAARKEIMTIIDRRRESEGDLGIGASIERQILSRELGEMEEDCESAGESEAATLTIEYRS